MSNEEWIAALNKWVAQIRKEEKERFRKHVRKLVQETKDDDAKLEGKIDAAVAKIHAEQQRQHAEQQRQYDARQAIINELKSKIRF